MAGRCAQEYLIQYMFSSELITMTVPHALHREGGAAFVIAVHMFSLPL